MEIIYRNFKPKLNSTQIRMLGNRATHNSTELRVELDVNDVLKLLSSNEEFVQLHKIGGMVSAELNIDKKKGVIILTVNGSLEIK